jgi:FkbM family methyltransferase
MRLFNRDIPMIVRNAYRIPGYFLLFLQCFWVFKHPLEDIFSYLRMCPPSSGIITLRDNTIIHLSSHPHDVVTVFIIFIRKDYGKIPAGSRVADIGANIGAFSLYAAQCGAAKVFAYEPNSEAFECLQRNIRSNSLAPVIVPRRFAVTGSTGKSVAFPKKASAYNSTLQNGTMEEHEIVDTISLHSIIKETGGIDFLKMDCEGSEWDILHSASPRDLASIRIIRMEYHFGYQQEIAAVLQNIGFSLQYLSGTKKSGTMWFMRT